MTVRALNKRLDVGNGFENERKHEQRYRIQEEGYDMNHNRRTTLRRTARWPFRGILLAVVALSVLTVNAVGVNSAQGAEIEGYTAPIREIHAASDETGIVEEVLVAEGQSVGEGDPLLRLNADVLIALLAIAEQNMNSVGRLDAARAELELRERRHSKLQALQDEGHARQEEVERAAVEEAIARANLVAAEEEHESRRLEYEKIKTQIERRTIVSPVDGIVSEIHKEIGEFVSPTSPEVLNLVQTSKLYANFTLTHQELEGLEKNSTVSLQFLNSGVKRNGTIQFISPVVDAESSLTLVRVLIDNKDGRVQSGERCTMTTED